MVLGGMVAMMCMWAWGPASCAILWRISMGRVDIPAALALVLDAMAFTRVSRRDLCLLCAYGPWYALNQVMLFCRYVVIGFVCAPSAASSLLCECHCSCLCTCDTCVLSV